MLPVPPSAEFPTTVETAEDAAAQGDDIVLGAPNVVRGGSHTGWIDATEMIARGLCSVLASDYYYPAPLLAGFALAARGVTSLARAWRLLSGTPATAFGLDLLRLALANGWDQKHVHNPADAHDLGRVLSSALRGGGPHFLVGKTDVSKEQPGSVRPRPKRHVLDCAVLMRAELSGDP